MQPPARCDTERRQAAPGAARSRRESIGLGLTLLGSLVAVMVPLAVSPKFYFQDDMQQYSLPTFRHIGDALAGFHLPFLSLSTWSGGNFFGEHQLGLLNPISLISYAALSFVHDNYVASALLGGVYTTIMACGVYFLCRTYGTDPVTASVAAFAAATNNFVAYWLAADWIAILVSLAWAFWAWAFLNIAHQSRGKWLLALLFCYLTVASGWPQTTLVICALACLIGGSRWWDESWPRAAAPVAAAILAGLLAAPAWLAPIPLGAVGSRPSGLYNGGLLMPNLRDVLAVSAPFHTGHMMMFKGWGRTLTPMFYVGWFVLPLAPFLRWERLAVHRRQLVPVFLLVLALFLASQGPEQAGLLRWPFRFLPFAQIALVVMFFVAAGRSGFAPMTRGRLAIGGGLILFFFVSGLQSVPKSATAHAISAVVIAAASLGVLHLSARGRTAGACALMAAVTAGFFVATRIVYPANVDVADWGVPRGVPARAAFVQVPRAYTFVDGLIGDIKNPDRVAEMQFGQIHLDYGNAVINGYTPIGHKRFSPFFCFDTFGETCPGASNRLLDIDAKTGVSLGDLMRVDRVVLRRGSHVPASRIPQTWELAREGQAVLFYKRALPNAALPGSLSWVSPGLTLGEVQPPRTNLERYRIAGTAAGLAVFSRLTWPGYHLLLDGREIPVVPHHDFLVSAEIPAGPDGRTLELVFRPPFFRIGWGMAGLALLGAVLVWLSWGRAIPPQARL